MGHRPSPIAHRPSHAVRNYHNQNYHYQNYHYQNYHYQNYH